MGGERVFRSVVLVGLALAGCDHSASEDTEPATPEPATPAETEPEADRAPADSQVGEVEAPSEVADVEGECPEGSELPDPPCFYIL